MIAEISLEEIESKLLTTFPTLGNIAPIRKLGDGWGSIAFEGNNNLVFRIAKNKLIQKQHKRQVAILPTIAVELKGLHVPLPDYYVASSPAFPFGVMGYRKIEGAVLDPQQISEENLASIASQIAAMLLSFHHIPLAKVPSTVPTTDYSQQTLQKTWNTAVQWLKLHLRQKDYQRAEVWWGECMGYFKTHPHKIVFVHGDPWYENIILNDKLQIKGIVDFDKVALGDHAIDFVVQQYVSNDFMNAVVRAYQELGGELGDNFELRVKYLTGIKALEDLNYGLHIGHVYPEALKHIKGSILLVQ